MGAIVLGGIGIGGAVAIQISSSLNAYQSEINALKAKGVFTHHVSACVFTELIMVG